MLTELRTIFCEREVWKGFEDEGSLAGLPAPWATGELMPRGHTWVWSTELERGGYTYSSYGFCRSLCCSAVCYEGTLFSESWGVIFVRVQKKTREVRNCLENLPQNDGKLRAALITTYRFPHREESYGHGEQTNAPEDPVAGRWVNSD